MLPVLCFILHMYPTNAQYCCRSPNSYTPIELQSLLHVTVACTGSGSDVQMTESSSTEVAARGAFVERRAKAKLALAAEHFNRDYKKGFQYLQVSTARPLQQHAQFSPLVLVSSARKHPLGLAVYLVYVPAQEDMPAG